MSRQLSTHRVSSGVRGLSLEPLPQSHLVSHLGARIVKEWVAKVIFGLSAELFYRVNFGRARVNTGLHRRRFGSNSSFLSPNHWSRRPIDIGALICSRSTPPQAGEYVPTLSPARDSSVCVRAACVLSALHSSVHSAHSVYVCSSLSHRERGKRSEKVKCLYIRVYCTLCAIGVDSLGTTVEAYVQCAPIRSSCVELSAVNIGEERRFKRTR